MAGSAYSRQDAAYAFPLQFIVSLIKPPRHQRSGKWLSSEHQREPGDRVLESTSAKGNIRGTARQLVEHSFQVAEEARLASNRLATQAFLQSAEHYVRLGNPVRYAENQPAKQQPRARTPIAIETSASAGEALLEMPVAAVCTGKTPEPETAIVVKALEIPETKSGEQAGIASRRAAAADALERVAGQHGYTLAQLGLVLQPD